MNPAYEALLAARLKWKRQQLGMSLTDVAAIAGVSKGHISEFENGKVDLTVRLMGRLLNAYGLDWTFLNEACEHEYACVKCGERRDGA